MNLNQIASLIPQEYRTEILQTNMVANAVAVSTDANMYYLATIWRNYVSPEDITCSLCLERILKNYKQLLPTLIEMEKQKNLLNSI